MTQTLTRPTGPASQLPPPSFESARSQQPVPAGHSFARWVRRWGAVVLPAAVGLSWLAMTLDFQNVVHRQLAVGLSVIVLAYFFRIASGRRMLPPGGIKG